MMRREVICDLARKCVQIIPQNLRESALDLRESALKLSLIKHSENQL